MNHELKTRRLSALNQRRRKHYQQKERAPWAERLKLGFPDAESISDLPEVLDVVDALQREVIRRRCEQALDSCGPALSYEQEQFLLLSLVESADSMSIGMGSPPSVFELQVGAAALRSMARNLGWKA